MRAIIAAPDDDLPRLMFADWLEEHGDARGEFIRVQCEPAAMSPAERCETGKGACPQPLGLLVEALAGPKQYPDRVDGRRLPGVHLLDRVGDACNKRRRDFFSGRGATRMQAVSGEEFQRWTAGHGIGVDPCYPDSGCLSLLLYPGHARFWVVPGDPAMWPHFVTSLLDGLDEWATGLLWPRSGSWPECGRSRSSNEGVRDVVLRGAGIPDGWPGAVRFKRDEEGALAAVLFAYLAFGWCVDDDLFFVPDHGRQLLQTDHHDVVHAKCATEERVRELVAHMAAEGYELPAEPPDGTFRRPAWMGGTEGGT